jgi:hypothetical protein
MTTKSPDPSETGSIFASGEVAEQWHRARAQRGDVTGPASEMMLDLANLGPVVEFSTLRPAQGTRRSWQLDASDRRAMYWPRTFLPIC